MFGDIFGMIFLYIEKEILRLARAHGWSGSDVRHLAIFKLLFLINDFSDLKFTLS